MADEVKPQDIAPAAVTPAPVETPSVPAPDAAVIPAAAVEAKSPEAAAPEVKADAVTNVMGDTETPKADAPKPEVKAETKTEAPKADAPKAETPPETKTETVLPTYDAFKLPENFTVDETQMGEFTKVLGELETGKLDHAAMQAKGQQLVELGVKAVENAITRQNDYYVQIHEQQKQQWFDQFKTDAQLGGDNVGKTVSAVREAIDTFGGSSEQVKELREQMKSSGYGNYTPLIRLINNMQQKINSYTKESDSKVMVPGAKPAPTKLKPYQSSYAGNQG